MHPDEALGGVNAAVRVLEQRIPRHRVVAIALRATGHVACRRFPIYSATTATKLTCDARNIANRDEPMNDAPDNGILSG